MFKIRVETKFNASHQLIFSDGKKEPLHEHQWKLWVDVKNEKLDDIGLVMDFHLLEEIIKKAVAEMNNVSLNEIEYFQENNPSAENVAKYVFERVEPQLPNDVTLASVRVFEQPNFSAKFAK